MLPMTRCDEYLYSVPKFDLTKSDVKDFNNELNGFHEQLADCFQRSESRDHFFKYMSGQLRKKKNDTSLTIATSAIVPNNS